MSYKYQEGIPTGRSGISVRYSTDAPVEAPLTLDGRVAAVFQSDSGPVDDVSILTSLKQAQQVYGTTGTTDIFEPMFRGGATEVYAMRLPAVGALAGKATLNVVDKPKIIQLTKGDEKDGTAVETAGVTFDFSKNQITVAFSNVPEGYTPTVRVRGQVGILAFVPGRFEGTSISNGTKWYVRYYPGAPINGQMTVEAVLTKDKPTVLKSCTYTCAEAYEESPVQAGKINLELKHPGAREVALQLKQDLVDETKMTFKLLEAGTEIETLQYSIEEGQNQVENLLTALNDSQYITVTSKPENLNTTAYVDQIASLNFTGGKDGEINVESYSKAFETLGKNRFASMAIDTVDEDVIALAKEFTDHCYDNGRYFMLTVGTEPDTDVNERLERVAAIDDRNVAAVGAGYYDANGNPVDGYKFAAQVAAMISAEPVQRSITWNAIDGAIRLIGNLTNDEYKLCNQKGLINITFNDLDEIVIEKGVTTLQTLEPGIDDAGWKKIKRVKTRNGIQFSISRRLSPYVGNLAPTQNNKSFVRGLIEGVLSDEFVSTSCITSDYSVVETDEIDEPNAFCYLIDVHDYDTGEEFYLHYVYHYQIANNE